MKTIQRITLPWPEAGNLYEANKDELTFVRYTGDVEWHIAMDWCIITHGVYNKEMRFLLSCDDLVKGRIDDDWKQPVELGQMLIVDGLCAKCVKRMHDRVEFFLAACEKLSSCEKD